MCSMSIIVMSSVGKGSCIVSEMKMLEIATRFIHYGEVKFFLVIYDEAPEFGSRLESVT
jgi:hypothetical protein